MNAIIKAAAITWLLDHKIKVVHIWEVGPRQWSAMVETPPSGTRAGAISYPAEQRVGCGSGDTGLNALLAALHSVNGLSLKFRLHLLEFLVDHLANRAGPALLRRLEGGGRS